VQATVMMQIWSQVRARIRQLSVRGATRARPLGLALVYAMAMLAPPPAGAIDIEFSGRAVRREILAFYDSTHEKTPQTTRIHHFAEMPLNWLGYKITYVDVNGALPELADLGRYRGILTWFVEPMQRVERYLDWLDKATARGTRHVVIAEFAPPLMNGTSPQLTRILGRLGMKPSNQYVNVTHTAKILTADPEMIGFERPIDKALPDFRVLPLIPGKATVHLSAQAPVRFGGDISALIVTNDAGGYLADEYSIYFEPNTDKVRWTANPFQFFKLAFGDNRFPVPDVTTLAGRRIYFSHIDGDGWNNVSQVEGFREQQLTSAEVARRELIGAFPDLPVSIGVIVGDIAVDLGGTAAGAEIARKLYAMPNVEVASHTYTHPFEWSFFETYSRATEEDMIEKAFKPNLSLGDRINGVMYKAARKASPADKTNKYMAGGSDLPRSYLKEPFELNKEVQGALRAAESLAPAGKKAKLYLWSGNTTPFEGAIKATRDAGVRNLNGGDSRLDKEFPSIFYVPPIGRPVGKERQIYAVNSNENTYTNDWTGPFYGFFMLEHTWQNTERPRRLKPMNLYYHMYVAERAGALAAVKRFLTTTRSAEVIPVAASDYAAIADDFYGVEIEQVDLFAWAITKRGTVQTMRFDAADALAVDMVKSIGVLGSNRHERSLYVALDSAVDRPIVSLRSRAEAAAAAPAGGTDAAQPGAAPTTAAVNPPPIASLVSSRWNVSKRATTTCGMSIDVQGFGPGEMTWATTAGRGFRVTVERTGRKLSEQIHWADAAGRLALRLEADAIEPLQVRLDCHE
jgi:polysaccharide biosynthesis protein PelA